MQKRTLFFALIVSLIVSVETRGQSHPYLLFNQSDLPAIRTRAHTQGTPELPPWTIWNRLILDKQANHFLTLQGGVELLDPVNWIENNISSLALAYHIEQNPVYLARIRTILWQGIPPFVGMLFQDPCAPSNYWNKAHQVIGLSLVYDLLYNEFSDQELIDIKTAIRAKIFNCGLRDYDYWPWASDYGANQFALRGSALGIAALTLFGDPIYPEAASDLNHLRSRLLTANDSFVKRCFSDGGSAEGIYYGLASLMTSLPFMHALSRWDNYDYFSDNDISRSLGQIGEAVAYEVSPHPRLGWNRYFNDLNDSYGNFYNSSGFFAPLLSLTGIYQSGLAQWVFDETVGSIAQVLANPNVEWQKRAGTEALFLSFLKYDGVQSVEPSMVLPKSRLFKERGVAYIRTATPWASYDDIQFAMEGHQMVNPTTGYFTTGHTQSDKNHFTLYAYGQDFVIDFGYTSNPNSSDEHNYVLIDGKGQAVNPFFFDNSLYGEVGSGRLDMITSPSLDFLVGDAKRAFDYVHTPGHLCSTPPSYPYCLKGENDPRYSPFVNPVQEAKRLVHFVRSADGVPSFIIVADDIQKDQAEHEYRWRFHSRGSIASQGSPIIVNGNENSSNKLFVFYHTASQSAPLVDSEVLTIEPAAWMYAPDDPPPSALVARCDIVSTNVVNPYFHILLFPHKATFTIPPDVSTMSITNGSILKAAWENGPYTDYSIFKHQNNQQTSGQGFITDAKLSRVRVNAASGSATSFAMCEGSYITSPVGELVNLYGSQGTVMKEGTQVSITGTVGYFRVHCPGTTSVKVNGNEVPFVQVGDHVESALVNVERVWSGVIITNTDVSVSPGVTLTLVPGSTFTFGPNSLAVYGTLVADGVTFTSNGMWGGIISGLYSPTLSLTQCSFSNASAALNVSNTTTLTVEQSTFVNCALGINVFHGGGEEANEMLIKNCSFSSFPINSTAIALHGFSNARLEGNILTGPGIKSTGIYLDGASPTIVGNSIEYFKYGLACVNGSSPMLEDGERGGFNLLSNNLTGVHCDGSDANLGTLLHSGDEGGHNTLCLNGIDITARQSKVFAQNNSWGSDEDPPGIFEMEDAWIEYAPWLTPTPNCGGLQMAGETRKDTGEGGGILNSLTPFERQILRERKRGNYAQAEALLRAALNDRSTPLSTKLWSLGQVLAVGQRLRGTNIGLYIGSLVSQSSLASRARAMLPAAYLHQGRVADAVAAYDANLQFYPGTSAARDALFGKFMHQLHIRHNSTEARRMLEQLESAFPQSLEAEAAALQLQVVQHSGMGGSNTVMLKPADGGTLLRGEAPASYVLHQNFPNPFNPVTTIRFELPSAERVTLRVYNLLGQEVAVVVNDVRDAGYHQATFDGSGLPSGIYFYRLTAGSFSAVKKLVLLH